MALAAMRCRMSQMADPEALQDELKNLSRCYPGWRWEEEGETLHVWVRVAQDTQSHDVKFRVFGDRVSLVVKSTKVFDSLRVLTDLEADECFWTLESDSARGGARSVHLWLKRCCETSRVKVEDVCFRDALPPALYTTKVFGGQEPKRPVKKKKKKATTKETIVQVGAPARRVVKPPQQVDLFYGVPTCSDEGWSIVSGPAMKSTESGLLVLPPLDAESASAERVEFFEEKETLRQKTCVFNPFLQLGFKLDEPTHQVISLVQGGQASALGVLKGWRAIAVSPPSLERPLRSIQEIMDASTVSRQNGVDLEILFEGAI